ncbi:sulfurtransferase TusA family protein [Paenibacillus harenae]|uniref:sulfurtransferase TusA family protein n=1 Tax=Paenibacillus harenae TaxID=306543 RepID=UPI00278FED87|nr:rhodanese-related sulfurtransferase/TusA-related sulfurtransferase [Paenibacillus harenae]
MTQPSIRANTILDCQGLACPMPIVRTKKAIESLIPGEVIEVQATDRGSLADIQSWAKKTGHHYLGTVEEGGGGMLKHFIRKAASSEEKQDLSYPHTTTADQLQKLQADAITKLVVLDVREPAEYAFEHIPGAVSIPLGELEHRMNQELDSNTAIHVVCRSGNRSDIACQMLSEAGFSKVHNVISGMSGWTGAVEGIRAKEGGRANHE